MKIVYQAVPAVCCQAGCCVYLSHGSPMQRKYYVQMYILHIYAAYVAGTRTHPLIHGPPSKRDPQTSANEHTQQEQTTHHSGDHSRWGEEAKGSTALVDKQLCLWLGLHNHSKRKPFLFSKNYRYLLSCLSPGSEGTKEEEQQEQRTLDITRPSGEGGEHRESPRARWRRCSVSLRPWTNPQGSDVVSPFPYYYYYCAAVDFIFARPLYTLLLL